MLEKMIDGLPCTGPDRGNKYVCSAETAINFKMCDSKEDLDSSEGFFKPAFTHQVFGEKEVIFGYKGLRIDIFFSAGTLTQYVKIDYAEKISSGTSFEADNILKLLADITPGGFTTNYVEFTVDLEMNRKFHPPGTLVDSYTKGDRVFDVYYATFEDEKFRNYHNRLQVFILWYIDAASYIDDEDPGWNLYTLYERITDSSGDTKYRSMGFLTAYSFYNYPRRTRQRISQVLVLPPFQGHGHGAHLLSTMYNHVSADPAIFDITVEDPSENFTRLRNFVDTVKCSNLAAFAPDKLKLGFSQAMADEARERYKITAIQSRKMYEILRLRATDTSCPEAHKAYRLDVKRRLNKAFQKEKKAMARQRARLTEEELKALDATKTPEQQHEFLERSFLELETEYRKVIERMAAFVEF